MIAISILLIDFLEKLLSFFRLMDLYDNKEEEAYSKMIRNLFMINSFLELQER